MKTIKIKGKEYVPVVERIKEFHKLYPNGEIRTEIVNCGETRVAVKAFIIIPDEKALGGNRAYHGHSQAEWGKGMMGDVALEIAETSAIGRALGFANIGLLDGIASADEMRKISKTKSTDKPPFGPGSEEDNDDFIG